MAVVVAALAGAEASAGDCADAGAVREAADTLRQASAVNRVLRAADMSSSGSVQYGSMLGAAGSTVGARRAGPSPSLGL